MSKARGPLLDGTPGDPDRPAPRMQIAFKDVGATDDQTVEISQAGRGQFRLSVMINGKPRMFVGTCSADVRAQFSTVLLSEKNAGKGRKL